MRSRFNDTLIKLTLLEVFSSLAKKYHLNPSKMKIDYSFDEASKLPKIKVQELKEDFGIKYDEFTNKPNQKETEQLRYLKGLFRLTYLKLVIGSMSLKKEVSNITFSIRLAKRGLKPLVDILINGKKVSRELLDELFRKAREEKLLTINPN